MPKVRLARGRCSSVIPRKGLSRLVSLQHQTISAVNYKLWRGPFLSAPEAQESKNMPLRIQ